MAKMGITATFVSPDATEEELNAAFKPNTKLMFGETIANPALTVLDIELFAKVAHAHGVPLMVDNTLTGWHMLINIRGFAHQMRVIMELLMQKNSEKRARLLQNVPHSLCVIWAVCSLRKVLLS